MTPSRTLSLLTCLAAFLLALPAAGGKGASSPRRRPRRAGPDWWSLQALTRPTPLAVKRRDWPRGPLDAFILAALEREGLEPAPPADRRTLIRRVTFDLLGLPPSPEEVDAFERDPAPDAYERVVERLLASPHYGERWARHWLDVVRFGESQGYERDKIRDHAFRYRDYVLRSFNTDKPYPQFIVEQLAGDVEPGTPEGIVATGFLVAGPWDEVGNTQQSVVMRQRVREEELEDMISAVAQTFLGLTVNCARCHNHKFDPIAQADYYRFKAAFEGVRHGDRSLLTPAEAHRRAERFRRSLRQAADLEKRASDIEQTARARVRQARPKVPGTPRPLACWTFETDARDAIGSLHGTLHGGAAVAGGRLRLNGKGAFLRTAPLARPLRVKTLEAWVTPANLTQRGGGVLSVESSGGRIFDAIVFGERQPGQWVAGSDFFRRTRDLAAPAETARPGQLAHLAIVYDAGHGIQVYRDGKPHGARYVPSGPGAALQTYAAGDAHVLFGLRHTGAGNGFFAGEVEEARLYDRALTATEVAASFRAGPDAPRPAEVAAALTPTERSRRADLLAEAARTRAALAVLPAPGLAYAANSKQPGATFVLARGDVEKPRERVRAGGLAAVKGPPADFGLGADAPEGQRRLKLAQWIARPDNPLTARVLVNRVWHYHFGRGLVATPSDFGFNGGQPSHPHLLDWLASDLIAGGWSIKHLHRRILLSAAYRQSARFDPRAAARDADNRLLWRFPPRRLEGEAVRDALLAVSGRLNRQMGGPSFRPFTVKVFNSNFYELTDPPGPAFERRTIYRINVNSAKNPLLDALDCPDPSVKTPHRGVTTTPLQALGLMNNSFVLRQARAFADRVRAEAGNDVAAQVPRAWRLALGRPPTPAEVRRAAALVREHGLRELCWVLVNANEFLYVR